jgi:hypothetical protein
VNLLVTVNPLVGGDDWTQTGKRGEEYCVRGLRGVSRAFRGVRIYEAGAEAEAGTPPPTSPTLSHASSASASFTARLAGELSEALEVSEEGMAFGDSADERAAESDDEGASPPQQTVGWRVLESAPTGGGLAGDPASNKELPPHEYLPHEPASGSSAPLLSSFASSGALTPPRLPTEQQVQFEVDQAA